MTPCDEQTSKLEGFPALGLPVESIMALTKKKWKLKNE